jgi:hypothetical protein
MIFYSKGLSRFGTVKDLRLNVTVKVAPKGGVSKQSASEVETALRELGLTDEID